MKSPPYLVSFFDKEDLKKALSKETIAADAIEIERLIEIGIPPVTSVSVLSVLFGYSAGFVVSITKRSERHYRKFEIKKGKKVRTITAPKVGLKIVQKWLSTHLAKLYDHDNVYGFIPGKSTKDAAAIHCGSLTVYSADIVDFFQSISHELVANALVKIGYTAKQAGIIASLCCYKDYLAQGSPASPVISNMVLSDFDNEISAYCTQNTLRYTRYADDITISSTRILSEKEIGEIKAQVIAQLDRCNLKMSYKKEKVIYSPNRMKIYGLIVNGDKPRLTKGYKNRIRAFKHLKDNFLIKNDDIKKIDGHINYSLFIEK